MEQNRFSRGASDRQNLQQRDVPSASSSVEPSQGHYDDALRFAGHYAATPLGVKDYAYSYNPDSPYDMRTPGLENVPSFLRTSEAAEPSSTPSMTTCYEPVGNQGDVAMAPDARDTGDYSHLSSPDAIV